MFYLIETNRQFEQFSTYNLDICFVEIITSNPLCHPKLSPVSLVYIKPMKSRGGFILAVDHSETMKLDIDRIWSLLRDKTRQIYVLDSKRAYYYPLPKDRLYCLKTAKFLATGEKLDDTLFNTPAHNFFYQKYPEADTNCIIPVAKHSEKWDNFSLNLKQKREWFEPNYYKFYNEMGNDVFQQIESNGLMVDTKLLHTLKFKKESFSYDGQKVYTQYDLLTRTGRPSNTFNGINFPSLNKDDNSRAFIIPANDMLIEFDYSAYHLTILSHILDFHFEGDIHISLGKTYFNKEELTDEEYEQAKRLTFKLLYTEGESQHRDSPFIKAVTKKKNELWHDYQQSQSLESLISHRPLRGVETKTQILPYLLQNYETERNILILKGLLHHMKNFKSKVVLYSYDSILIDFSKADGTQLLVDIKDMLEQGGFQVKVSYGKNYAAMKKMPIAE